MGRRFHPQTAYAEITTFDADWLRQSLLRFLDRPDVLVLIAPDGFLIMTLVQLHFCRELVAAEVSLRAKGSGTALLKAGEAWAKANGAVANLTDSTAAEKQARADRWYARKGYRPLGHMHMKAL